MLSVARAFEIPDVGSKMWSLMLLETENAPGWVTWPCLMQLCVFPQASPCLEAAAVSEL